MKKILFSLCFFSLMVVGAQAQKASCAKTCTKSSAASAACHEKAPSAASVTTGTGTGSSVDAAKLASMDASIETRTDPGTGNVSYVRKETCSHSGKVSYVDVNYDATTNSFVNVSPVKAMGSGTGCGSKATSASGKACCTNGAAMGKSCCAGKAGSTKTAEKVKS